MEPRKRIVSFITAILVIISSMPIAYAADDDTKAEKTKIYVNNDVANYVADVEYGWDAQSYSFSKDALSGVSSDDEVYLTASVAVTGASATPDSVGNESIKTLYRAETSVDIELFGFKLEGDDADKYILLNEITEPISKTIKIEKKKIKISPEQTSIFYGQVLPENNELVGAADYSDQIIDGDDVELEDTPVFQVDFCNKYAVGSYKVSLKGPKDSLGLKGKNSCNYEAIFDVQSEFNICEYNTEVTVDKESINYAGATDDELTAPENFLISSSNDTADENWYTSISFPLVEGENSAFEYYLRNNNPDDEENYRAISVAKEYRYASCQTPPTVTNIEVERAETASPDTASSDESVYSETNVYNTDLSITVTVETKYFAQNTTVCLNVGENGDFKSLELDEDDFIADEDSGEKKYVCSAEFSFNVKGGEYVNWQPIAYAVNKSGKSENYSGVTITVDKEEPQVQNLSIDGNYRSSGSAADSVKAEFTVSDLGSGIAKIEYLWDNGFKLDPNDAALQTDYVEFKDYSENQNTYTLILPFACAQELSDNVEDNKHTLHLRVTDKAGNISMCDKTAEDGSDIHPPKIESVNIRKTEDDTSDTDVNFFDFGTFYNGEVEISITATDNTSESVDVRVNGIAAQKSDDTVNEYVLKLKPNFFEILNITATDSNGLSVTKTLSEIEMCGNIASNGLMLESTASAVDFGDFLEQGHKDNSGNIWFGAGDADIAAEISVSDEEGELNSGLRSVKIYDNDTEISTKTDFASDSLNFASSFSIGDFADSDGHTLKVIAADNCGNVTESSVTFCKDTEAPNKGVITAVSPEAVTIDGNLWYDKDDVISFRADCSDALSGVKSVYLEINGKEFNFTGEDIKTDENGTLYVIADTNGIETDSEHRYIVTGVVTDFAENTLEMESLIVYKDFEIPTVEKLTIQKSSSVLDKVLNVLTFGAYSNDSVVIKAHTEDTAFDSGIDYATISYDGVSQPIVMTDEGDGVFSSEIKLSETVFESEINIYVYDKFGKVSNICPNISDAESEAISTGRLVMLENILPGVEFTLPDSDSIERDDGQTWYSSNKTVELSVRDADSGVRNIDVTVNGVDVSEDKNGLRILKVSDTESDLSRINSELQYVFDTDYLTSACGESKDGKYVIRAEVTDNAGNVNFAESTYYVDKVSPTVDKIEFTPKTSDNKADTSEFIEELEYGYYFKTDFIATVVVSDAKPSSGLYKINYRLVPYQNGEKLTETAGTEKISGGKAEIAVPSGFKGQIYVEAFDCVLNSLGEKTPKAYVEDNAVPNIKITQNVKTDYHDSEGNSLYVETNSFTVVVTDTVSGIKQVSYSQNAEQNPYAEKTVEIADGGYDLDTLLDDDWTVTGTDVNLVTQITKTFTFEDDDNDVEVTFNAVDNSGNEQSSVKSEKFTVDKTSPVIDIVFRDDNDDDVYYNQNRIADITITERNFDASLIKTDIENMFGSVPSFSFTDVSSTIHTAVIDFDEGDYTFEMSGTDLGNHSAEVNYSGGNEKLFYVDKTNPVIEENFAEFENSAENSFKTDKTVNITITEHNFDSELTNLKIWRKNAGTEHNSEGFEDATDETLGVAKWEDSDDLHTISFTIDRDAVYYVEIAPVDLASNAADKRSTSVFEIDETVPVVSMKNGEWVSEDNTEFLDVYPYERKDADAPSVEFTDLNISYIKYELSEYIPDYTTSVDVVVRPKTTSGTVEGSKFTLSDFKEDGVYALKLTAVDIAGNESELNFNTYARMVEQDVLAFLMDSDPEEKTGLYSFEYENGDAISKKPSSFDDLKIFVMSKKDTPVDIVLRDDNGEEIVTNAQCVADDSLYGIGIYNYLLESDFFKENFQSDTDIEMRLTVKNQGYRIDLGKMHIDNIAPSCTLPDDLNSWQWFYGDDERTFTISNISEVLYKNGCKVYDNGSEIPFTYSESDDTVTFTLSKGWHNVGVVLDDMAGNVNNISEKSNIHIGYFWLWIIMALLIMLLACAVGIIIYSRHIKKRRFAED